MNAEYYARNMLGMTDEEPNEATGFELAQAFLDMTEAFEAGRREGAETMRRAAAKATSDVASDFSEELAERTAAAIRALPTETEAPNA